MMTIAAGLIFMSGAWAQNVYRYTDSDGKVHYSPTLPPEQANLPYDILSPSGVLIERVLEPVTPNSEREKEREAAGEEGVEKTRDGLVPLYSASERQKRSDRLLLLKYSSEDEILIAMELEIEQLEYDSRILAKTRDSVESTLGTQIKTAAEKQRAGMPLTEKQLEEIDMLQRRLFANDATSERLKKRRMSIHDKFMYELDRYRELVAEEPTG